MATPKMILVLLCLIGWNLSATYAQQQLTQTVTSQNQNCNATCSVIDVAALNNNPAAIIFITPVSGNVMNQHPIGAYYMYLNKWSVFNLDGTALTIGAKFNVEYYVNSDSSHFVYVVPPRVHANDLSYIDRVGLNSNANAQIRIFPTTSATVGNIYNKNDIESCIRRDGLKMVCRQRQQLASTTRFGLQRYVWQRIQCYKPTRKHRHQSTSSVTHKFGRHLQLLYQPHFHQTEMPVAISAELILIRPSEDFRANLSRSLRR